MSALMFKKFGKGDYSGRVKIKSSVQRAMRTTLLELYPGNEEYIEDIFPKEVEEVKMRDKSTLIVVGREPIFFHSRDGPLLPTLRLLHKYPELMPRVQVDKGATRFVFGGADVMTPGLTSAGGRIDVDLPAGHPVAIYAEGKEHAVAVGITKISTAEMRSSGRGIAVQVVHHLDDCLWKMPELL